MATTSFPTVHRCLHSGDSRINSSLLCLVLPLRYPSNPSSLNSPQSFEFGHNLYHFGNSRSRRSSKVPLSTSKSLVFPCEASIRRITEQEYTSQHCCCSPISSHWGPGISVFEKHACGSCGSRNRRTINFKENHLTCTWVGFQTGSLRMSCLARFNLFVTFGAECGIEELDAEEALIDDVEEETSRENLVTHHSVEVGNDDSVPSVIGKGSGIRLRYLEERDKEAFSKQILELSRSNKLRSALELFRSMEIFRLTPNLHACNSLLSCLLRNGMLDDALGVFEYMKNKRIISGHSFSLVFKAVAEARGSDEAIQMFMEAVRKNDHEKDFDVVVYNTIITICAKANDWSQMERVWCILKENGHIGNTITYNILICTFVRCSQYELSIAAYSEMLQSGIKPGVDSMHAVIGACTKEGNWDLAMRVYESMLVSGLKPNLIAFNALINLLGRSGKVETAFRVYDQMELFGHTPDAHTWNALLGALYMADQYARALHLFHTIRTQQRVQLNTELYNTALMCCQRLRLWEKGIQLLWLMEGSGLTVTTASYNLVIATCEGARKPKVALQVFEHMVHQKCPADTFTYLSIARSCIWGSLWYEVETILDLTSNVSLYNAIIQGMCLRGKVDAAKRLYTKMREIGLVPDGKTRAMMLQHLIKRCR